MKRKTRAYLYVITLPFVVSASWQFLEAWLYFPITLICGMAWLGACGILAEKEKE
jgi:hypothetical protein